MFSALQQGGVLYILEKSNTPTYKIGQIQSISSQKYTSNFMLSTVDITVKVDDQKLDFKNIPSSQSIAYYNDVIITETKEQMLSEVENLLQSSKNILESIDKHKAIVESCEEILKSLNPQFAKEQERDQRLNTLESKFETVESKIDQLITLVNTK